MRCVRQASVAPPTRITSHAVGWGLDPYVIIAQYHTCNSLVPDTFFWHFPTYHLLIECCHGMAFFYLQELLTSCSFTQQMLVHFLRRVG